MPRRHVVLIVLGLVAGVAAAAAVTLVFFWDAIPGTFYRDSNGFPHGTGRYTYRYHSGAVQLVEDYSRGKLIRSEWFKPDGTVVWTTEWKDDECGVGVYLREDGSIRKKMTYVHCLAKGPCTYYARDGRVVCESFVDDSGERVLSGEKPARGGKDD